MAKTVRAKYSANLWHPGGWSVFIKQGRAFDDSDPIVHAHPDAFVSDAEQDRQKAEQARLVEQATAAPGERRAVQIPRARKDDDA